jgi:hypothetical protein
MTRRDVWRWAPVLLYGLVALTIVLFWIVPSSRRASERTRQARETSTQVAARHAILTTLPQKRAALDSLVRQLREFRSALRMSDEVDAVMDGIRDRGRVADVDFWYLNPSVPTLVTLEEMPDSLARSDLVLLPVAFECRGKFLDVGRFLEREARRRDFCQWRKFSIAADPGSGGVRAHGEVLIILLPSPRESETTS